MCEAAHLEHAAETRVGVGETLTAETRDSRRAVALLRSNISCLPNDEANHLQVEHTAGSLRDMSMHIVAGSVRGRGPHGGGRAAKCAAPN